MKKIIIIFFLSNISFAQSIDLGSTFPSGGGGGVTSVTGTAPVVSSGGSTPAISMAAATSTIDGYLKYQDWLTFNGKQAAGNYLTALIGDVSASGPGSAASTLSPFVNQVYLDLASGNDSTGNGSPLKPWKTLQHTCNSISPTINVPIVIHVSGGNNDTDTGTITCPPDIDIVADYFIQLNNLTISGGSSNDAVSVSNIIFTGNVTWIRNDATAIQLGLINTSSFGTVDFEQQGSGVAQSFFFAYNPNTALNNLTIEASEAIIQAAGLIYGTINYKDSGSSYFYLSGSDLYNATIQLNGGVTAGFYGDFPEGATNIVGTTTGSGTPALGFDASSLPQLGSVTGSYTLASKINSFLSQSISGSQPVCSANTRGLQWLIQGGVGVADIYQICQKDSSDAYVWVTH